MKRQSTLIDLALLVLLCALYGLLYSYDAMWTWLESATGGSLMVVGLLIVPFLFGALTRAALGNRLRAPLFYLPLVPLLDLLATDIYIHVTYQGPKDSLGFGPYALKLIESLMVLLGAALITCLTAYAKKRALT